MRRKIYGPYHDKRRDEWRVIIAKDGTRAAAVRKTEDEARELIQKLEEELELDAPMTIKKALESYKDWLARSGLKEGTQATTKFRLQALLGSEGKRSMTSVDGRRAQLLYGELAKKQKADTHRNTLSAVRAFWRWAAKQGHVKYDPWRAVEPEGRRRKGKKQLRVDEARAFTSKALELAEAGDDGAVAALCCLLLGMRASEVVRRVGRDLDDGGSVLCITEAKTEAGERTLDIPEVLRPLLARLVRGPAEPLFPGRSRYWLREQVQRICRLAQTITVCPHGLRGTHATLAMAAGASSAIVASSLGHASPAVTLAHYAEKSAVASGQARAAMRVISGGKR